MVTRKTGGADFNFFEEISIADTEFPTESQITMNFKGPRHITLTNESASVIYYSFNGWTTHGTLTFDTPTAHLKFEFREGVGVWFKVDSGAEDVRVEAWGLTH